MGLAPRYFSARTTSKVPSGTSPCNNVNVRPSCQDEGARLRGVNSDFDNPIDGRLGAVVSAVGYDKETDVDALVDCPTNIPAIPAIPTNVIPAIGTRERWSSTHSRLCPPTENCLTLFE